MGTMEVNDIQVEWGVPAVSAEALSHLLIGDTRGKVTNVDFEATDMASFAPLRPHCTTTEALASTAANASVAHAGEAATNHWRRPCGLPLLAALATAAWCHCNALAETPPLALVGLSGGALRKSLQGHGRTGAAAGPTAG